MIGLLLFAARVDDIIIVYAQKPVINLFEFYLCKSI